MLALESARSLLEVSLLNRLIDSLALSAHMSSSSSSEASAYDEIGPHPLASPRDDESEQVIKSSRNAAENTTTIAMDGGQSLRGASFAGASFNFTKGMLGAGILGLPHAVAHCGFGVSCVAGAFLLFVCYLSMIFIVRVCPVHPRACAACSFFVLACHASLCCWCFFGTKKRGDERV